MQTIRFVVSDIACRGCAAAARAAVAAVEGVTDVEVDATTGEVSVHSDRSVELTVANALTDAGFEVAP